MKKTSLTLSLLLLAAGFAAARGRGGRSGGGFSSRGHFSRPLSRPTFSHSSSSRSSNSVTSHSGFAPSSSSRGVSTFAGQLRSARTSTTGSPGGGTGGGGTGSGSTGGTGGAGSTGGTSGTVSTEQGGWATPGSKILTAGQQPVYSTPAGGGTASVDGGGFIAVNQAQAGDVGRSPGVTWGRPTPTGGTGISGSGASSNGPAFNPAF